MLCVAVYEAGGDTGDTGDIGVVGVTPSGIDGIVLVNRAEFRLSLAGPIEKLRVCKNEFCV